MGNLAKTDIKNFIFVKNYFNKKDCKFLLEQLKNKKKTKHHWYSYSANQRTTQGDDEPDVCFANEIQSQFIIPVINKAIFDYEKKCVDPYFYGLTSRLSGIRFNFYNKNSHMRPHVDNIQSIFDGIEKGVPILSIVGHLNDNYEGGEFMMGDKVIPLKAGDILIFPSCFLYPHTVKQVKKGIRHSFVCWAY